MLKTLITVAALAAAGVAATPADAGSVNLSLSLSGPHGGIYFNDQGPRYTLSEGQVKQQLRYQGWRDVHIVDRDATTYRATATWAGYPYVLTVSAFDAAVLSYYANYPTYPAYPVYPSHPTLGLGFFGSLVAPY